MKLRGNKILAVMTVALLTLASGTVQAYASLCQPAEKPVQDSCCPPSQDGMQQENCAMDGCDCSIESQPTQQNDSPAVTNDNAPTWNVAAIESESRLISNDEIFTLETVVSRRDRGPPKEPERSANGLRAPPSQLA